MFYCDFCIYAFPYLIISHGNDPRVGELFPRKIKLKVFIGNGEFTPESTEAKPSDFVMAIPLNLMPLIRSEKFIFYFVTVL